MPMGRRDVCPLSGSAFEEPNGSRRCPQSGELEGDPETSVMTPTDGRLLGRSIPGVSIAASSRQCPLMPFLATNPVGRNGLQAYSDALGAFRRMRPIG